jgi:hypothetical protein
MFYNVAHAETRSLVNPLAGASSIGDVLYAIVNVLLVFAVPVIVFFIIFAGFSYVTAQGNPEKLKLASRSLMYALIGGVIIIGAGAIITIVQSIVTAF